MNHLIRCGVIAALSTSAAAQQHPEQANDPEELTVTATALEVEALEMMQQAFGAYRAVVADLSSDARAAAWSEVGECLTQFEGDDGLQVELEFAIGSGTTTT